MKNKSLIAAAAFSLAALVFLIWAFSGLSTLKAQAGQARDIWENTAKSRQTFQQLRANPELATPTAASRDDTPVPAVIDKLVNEGGMTMERMGTSESTTSDGTNYTVRLANAGITDVGAMLEKIAQNHRSLAVREIIISEPKIAAPGVFNWSLVIVAPKPAN